MKIDICAICIESPFSDFEYHPCKEFTGSDGESFIEEVKPEEAEFWFVYVRYDSNKNEGFGELDCIAVCESETDCQKLIELLNSLLRSYTPYFI